MIFLFLLFSKTKNQTEKNQIKYFSKRPLLIPLKIIVNNMSVTQDKGDSSMLSHHQ